MSIFELFLTLYLWAVSIVSLLVTFIVCLLCYPFIEQKTFSRLYEIIPAYIILYSMILPGFWRIKIHDYRRDKTWSDEQFVIIANHLSFIDSLVLAYSINLKKKFMVAEIFTSIPIFGWLSKTSGHVTADRFNPKLNQTSVDRAVETIQRDSCSFCLYPEGLRELTPYIFEKFKTGAFRIARKTGLRILPVTLKGTYEAVKFWGIAGLSEINVYIDEPFIVADDDFPFYINLTQHTFRKRLNL